MRYPGARGMALLNVLIALSIVSTVLAAAVPAALSFYARAAVEYEAMHLIGELRRVQAISRTTAMPLYVLEGRPSWERVPRLRIRADGYVLRRPFGDDVRVHRPLPLVQFEQETLKNTVVEFNRNGAIADNWKSHNMTICIYVPGYEEDALRVVIDRAARIRLQRGGGNAVDEE
ncbi:prepilin-type cleavage/methylation domain-containing protein [uncultured Selenomonas sp.]|uniref:prepilin-type cleavage/methylation domain-containing protein n=1 Tax=uncultured Selenomonas sp. TaxID=159275 RepID=UPI0028E80C76|nr:prepilin-type cleavage/methylation domain-containing protein [uncultured Selenomonas sp.]